MFNFYKMGLASPKINLADCKSNMQEINELIKKAIELEIQMVVFPQLALTGATCLDLFKQADLIEDAQKNLDKLLENLAQTNILYIVGAPIGFQNKIFNCALICQANKILAIVPKINLSANDKRYFSTIDKGFITKINGIPFGDLIFNVDDKFTMKINFDDEFSADADLNINLACKPIAIDNDYDEMIIKSNCIANKNACLFINNGFGESTTDFVYNGQGFIYELEEKLASTKKYAAQSEIIYQDIDIDAITKKINIKNNYEAMVKIKLPSQNNVTRKFSPNPFFKNLDEDKSLNEILLIQRNAIITRIKKAKAKKIIIGVSGGLDSTLTLLNSIFVCDYLNFSRDNIIAVTMPGFGTSNITFGNAQILLDNLGVTQKTISIKKSCIQHFDDINHDINDTNVTYENAQARERTQILFDLANDYQGLVLGTGDMSEMALGFTTFNGDHISNYNPNSNLPKTIIRLLLKFIANMNYFPLKINNCLLDILRTPISPELLPTSKNQITQQTENIIGPYQLNDFFLYYVLKHGYPKNKILFMAQSAFPSYSFDQLLKYFELFFSRFISQQFKRSCSNDGPQIFSFGLSPRSSFLLPSDI